MTEYLPIPSIPLSYESAGPYVVTFEWDDGKLLSWRVADLETAVFIYLDETRPTGEADSCRRRIIVDVRGAIILGLNEEISVLPHRPFLATDEVMATFVRIGQAHNVPFLADMVLEWSVDQIFLEAEGS